MTSPAAFPDHGDKEAVRRWMSLRRRSSEGRATPGTPDEFSIAQRERLLQAVGLQTVSSPRRLDVALTGPTTIDHTVRIAVLGQFLANLQDSVSAVAQALTGRPTIYSSIPRAVQDSTSLSASAVFPSSFGVTLYGPQAEAEEDGLFPMPAEDPGVALDDAVEKVLDIVNFSESVGFSDDLLTEELVPLGQRAMKHLGLLTTGLVEAELGLRLTWRGRNGLTRSGEWSPDGVRRVLYLCQQSQFGEPEAITLVGWLVSANVMRGTADIRTDSGEVVRAKTDEEVTPRLREYFDNRVEADAEVTTVSSVGGHVRKNYAILALRNID